MGPRVVCTSWCGVARTGGRAAHALHWGCCGAVVVRWWWGVLCHRLLHALHDRYKGSSAECEAALRDWAGSMEEKGEDAATSLRRAFATMDTDESGTLDATEIAAAIESLGVFVSKESVLAFVDEFGSRGGVTLEQFTSFALYVAAPRHRTTAPPRHHTTAPPHHHTTTPPALT